MNVAVAKQLVRHEENIAETTVVHRSMLFATLGTAAISAIFISFLAIIVFQVVQAQAQSHLDKTTKQIADEELMSKELTITQTKLQSPEHIIKEAKEKLGMVIPENVVYLEPQITDSQKLQEESPFFGTLPSNTLTTSTKTTQATKQTQTTSSSVSSVPKKTQSSTATTVAPKKNSTTTSKNNTTVTSKTVSSKQSSTNVSTK